MRFPPFPYCPMPYGAPRVIETKSSHSRDSVSKGALRGDSAHWVTSPQQLGAKINQQPPLPPPRDSFLSKISKIFTHGDFSILLRKKNHLFFEQGGIQNKILSHCQTMVEARREAWHMIPEVQEFFNTLYQPQHVTGIANAIKNDDPFQASPVQIPFSSRDNPSSLSALFERKVLNDLLATQSIPAEGQQYEQILNAIDPLIFWKKVLDETEKALQQGNYLPEILLLEFQMPDRAPFFLDDPKRYQQNTHVKQLNQALPYLKAKAFKAQLAWINALIHPQADVQKIQTLKSLYEQQNAHIQAIETHIEILKLISLSDKSFEVATQDSSPQDLSLEELSRLLQAEQKNPIVDALNATKKQNQEKDS
jgi:hypothetical protein